MLTGIKEGNPGRFGASGQGQWPPLIWAGRQMDAVGFIFFVFIDNKNVEIFKTLFCFFKVKNIYIQEEMFSIQNGLLTPTLKAKRPELKEFFKDKIEELYSSVSLWRPANIIILLHPSHHWLPAVHQHTRNLNQTCSGKFKMPKLQQNAIQYTCEKRDKVMFGWNFYIINKKGLFLWWWLFYDSRKWVKRWKRLKC